MTEVLRVRVDGGAVTVREQPAKVAAALIHVRMVENEDGTWTPVATWMPALILC